MSVSDDTILFHVLNSKKGIKIPHEFDPDLFHFPSCV